MKGTNRQRKKERPVYAVPSKNFRYICNGCPVPSAFRTGRFSQQPQKERRHYPGERADDRYHSFFKSCRTARRSHSGSLASAR